MRPQGISPNEEIELHKDHLEEQKMKNLGRGPTDCEIKERADSLKGRGVLAPTTDVVAYCDSEKAGSGANQSSVFRNFAGGKSVRLGAKLSDLRPKASGAKRALVDPRPPEVVPVDPVISECLVDKSPPSLGIPLNNECRMLGEGGEITIHYKKSGAMSDFLVRARSSGAKGFRAMLQSGRSGGWKCCAPNAESMEADAAQYAAAHKGGETVVSRGSWGSAILVLLVDDGGVGHRVVAPQQDTSAAERFPPISALCSDAPANRPRGFANCAVIDNAAIRNT